MHIGIDNTTIEQWERRIKFVSADDLAVYTRFYKTADQGSIKFRVDEIEVCKTFTISIPTSVFVTADWAKPGERYFWEDVEPLIQVILDQLQTGDRRPVLDIIHPDATDCEPTSWWEAPEID